jgi:hypothetical protein
LEAITALLPAYMDLLVREPLIHSVCTQIKIADTQNQISRLAKLDHHHYLHIFQH